jgi:two-component system cell cycle response regulator
MMNQRGSDEAGRIAGDKAASIRPPSGRPSMDRLPSAVMLAYPTERQLATLVSVSLDRATLTLLSGTNAGQVFALDKEEHVIGRAPDASVWLHDPDISRRHARIVRDKDGAFVIEDMKSTNGIFVGGHKVERSALQSGDRIHVGPNMALRFDITDDADRELQRRLYETSRRDALTHVYNREHFLERFAGEIAHARRHGTELALLLIDLDHFKRVNDTHGHLAGDATLRAVSEEITRIIRTEDIFARYGGEEFALLTRSITAPNACWLAERVRRAVQEMTVTAGEAIIKVTLSIGVACFSETRASIRPQDLIALADERLYDAKRAGRNCVRGE